MSHFYCPITAEARHFVEKKDGTGQRPSNVGDARKNGWLPSPTTVLAILAKPALTEWMVRQGVLAVCTAPDVPGEGIDAKITRVLDVERQQDQESEIAKDKGTEIHDAIEEALKSPLKPIDPELVLFVAPVLRYLAALGRVVSTERILVGDGHAGKTDAILENDEAITVCDFKTCKMPPRKPYKEAELQVSSYAASLGNTGNKRIRSLVIYISKEQPGLIQAFETDWKSDYQQFRLLLAYWCLANNIEQKKALV